MINCFFLLRSSLPGERAALPEGRASLLRITVRERESECQQFGLQSLRSSAVIHEDRWTVNSETDKSVTVLSERRQTTTKINVLLALLKLSDQLIFYYNFQCAAGQASDASLHFLKDELTHIF